MTIENTRLELGKIELRFGKMISTIDRCKLSEMAEDVLIIADSARALKQDGLISPVDHLKIVDRLRENINVANRNCTCKKR